MTQHADGTLFDVLRQLEYGVARPARDLRCTADALHRAVARGLVEVRPIVVQRHSGARRVRGFLLTGKGLAFRLAWESRHPSIGSR